MPAIDNTYLIAPLIDEDEDRDTFWYTELLDRRTNGASRVKLLRTFEHKCRAHFLEQMPAIRALCDQTGVRAYTRLSPRSRKQVAHHMAAKVVEQTLAGNYDQLRRAYAHSCGVTAIHGRKLWLFDVDEQNEFTEWFCATLEQAGRLRARIPSRSGIHFIAAPINLLGWGDEWPKHMSLHKDNPTNLYVPDGAA